MIKIAKRIICSLARLLQTWSEKMIIVGMHLLIAKDFLFVFLFDFSVGSESPTWMQSQKQL